MSHQTIKLNKSFIYILPFCVLIFCPKIFSYNQLSPIQVNLVSGRVLLSRTAQSTWNLLSLEPTTVSVGDILQSESDSYLTIKYPNSSICYVFPYTYITLIDNGLVLKNGEILFDIKPSEISTYTVLTPYAEINVLGTKFLVKVDKYGKTTVSVIKGIITIKAKNEQKNRQLVLQSGMQSTIDNPAQTPLNYTKFDASHFESLLNEKWAKIEGFKPLSKTKYIKELPPIRPIITSKIQNITQTTNVHSNIEKPLKETQDNLDKYPNIRSRLNFFKTLKEQRYIQNKYQTQDHMQETSTLGKRNLSWQVYYPTQNFEVNEPILLYKANTSAHTRFYGYNLPTPTYINNEKELIDEIYYLEQNLLYLKNKIQDLEKQRLDIINQLQTNSNVNINELRYNLSLVSKELDSLYNQKSLLVYKIDLLRNRLK